MADGFWKRRGLDTSFATATSFNEEVRRLMDQAAFTTKMVKRLGYVPSIADEMSRLAAGVIGDQSAFTSRMTKSLGHVPSIADEKRLATGIGDQAAFTSRMVRRLGYVPSIAGDISRLVAGIGDHAAFTSRMTKTFERLGLTGDLSPKASVAGHGPWSARDFAPDIFSAGGAATAVGALGMSTIGQAFWNSVSVAGLSRGMSAQVFTGVRGSSRVAR